MNNLNNLKYYLFLYLKNKKKVGKNLNIENYYKLFKIENDFEIENKFKKESKNKNIDKNSSENNSNSNRNYNRNCDTEINLIN